jgi:hypothetical protein
LAFVEFLCTPVTEKSQEIAEQPSLAVFRPQGEIFSTRGMRFLTFVRNAIVAFFPTLAKNLLKIGSSRSVFQIYIFFAGKGNII